MSATAARKRPARNALNKLLWALTKEAGLDGDELRDVSAEITGVRNPQTGEGSISRLNVTQIQTVIDHLRGDKKPRADWLASKKQIHYINSLHLRLRENGRLENPIGFMKSVTGCDAMNHLPKYNKDRKRIGAQGYIDLLKDMCEKSGITVY